MKDNKTLCKCLASLAVFRELYDNQKDVYGIISVFLSNIIELNKKYSFNLTEITNLLNNTYDFSLPEAVVKTSLNRLNYLEKAERLYSVTHFPKLGKHHVDGLHNEITANNNDILNSLFLFIEANKQLVLADEDKEEIVHSFCSFLLNDSGSELYSEYISAFIINKKEDGKIKSQLSKIREGVILYSGLKYDNNLNDVGSWKTKLNIYIDTEILFHFAGFNGEVYKSLFYAFFKFVKEINQKSQKNLIKLRYFTKVKDEIDGFFRRAESIVNGDITPNPRITAMNSIIDGCNTPSDVLEKKSDFYLNLKKSGIIEDDTTNKYIEENFQYNIIDKESSKELSKELDFDVNNILHFLNYISILRKGVKSNDFGNIGHILLTGKYKTIRVSLHEMVKTKDTIVPLATTLYWITNKFWFKLNKGFGKDVFPRSFDVITKAQILLSTELNESIGRQYDELQNQFNKGDLTEEQAKQRIVNLRANTSKPEEETSDNISSVLDIISEDSLRKHDHEQEHFRNKSAIQAEENKQLKRMIELNKQIIEGHKTQNEKINNELLNVKTKAENDSLNNKLEKKTILENQKSPITSEIKKKYNRLKFRIAFTFLLYYGITFFLIWKFKWAKMEPIVWITTIAVPLLFCIFYLLLFDKTFNPISYLRRKRKEYTEEKYKQFAYDDNELIKVSSEIEELQKIETNLD